MKNLIDIDVAKLLTHVESVTDILDAHSIPWFLAGGSIRDFIANTPIKDYDFWFKNKADADRVVSLLAQNGFDLDTEKSKSTNAVFTKNGKEINIILSRFFKNTDEIIKDFDFTCCAVAIDSSNRSIVHAHEYFLNDLVNKQLILNNIRTPVSTLERVVRFTSRGYSIDKKELRKIALFINQMDADDIDGLGY